jgi:hypothetical protein
MKTNALRKQLDDMLPALSNLRIRLSNGMCGDEAPHVFSLYNYPPIDNERCCCGAVTWAEAVELRRVHCAQILCDDGELSSEPEQNPFLRR